MSNIQCPMLKLPRQTAGGENILKKHLKYNKGIGRNSQIRRFFLKKLLHLAIENE